MFSLRGQLHLVKLGSRCKSCGSPQQSKQLLFIRYTRAAQGEIEFAERGMIMAAVAKP